MSGEGGAVLRHEKGGKRNVKREDGKGEGLTLRQTEWESVWENRFISQNWGFSYLSASTTGHNKPVKTSFFYHLLTFFDFHSFSSLQCSPHQFYLCEIHPQSTTGLIISAALTEMWPPLLSSFDTSQEINNKCILIFWGKIPSCAASPTTAAASSTEQAANGPTLPWCIVHGPTVSWANVYDNWLDYHSLHNVCIH